MVRVRVRASFSLVESSEYRTFGVSIPNHHIIIINIIVNIIVSGSSAMQRGSCSWYIHTFISSSCCNTNQQHYHTVTIFLTRLRIFRRKITKFLPIPLYMCTCCLNINSENLRSTISFKSLTKVFDSSPFLLGTCEASRFDSNRTIPIQFESDGLIRNFRISRTCRRTTNHVHCSTKKLQPLRCCNWDLLILCLCSKSIHTR